MDALASLNTRAYDGRAYENYAITMDFDALDDAWVAHAQIYRFRWDSKLAAYVDDRAWQFCEGGNDVSLMLDDSIETKAGDRRAGGADSAIVGKGRIDHLSLDKPAHGPSTDVWVMRWTLRGAVIITTVIACASFILSFAALWDLATRAGLPRNLSWLWPVIVDGTILQATISVIALAARAEQRAARRFFWMVLTVSALVSVSSNALHAFIAGSGTMHPALAASIATVAPVSLLASTHGIALLTRVRNLGNSSIDRFQNRCPDTDAGEPKQHRIVTRPPASAFASEGPSATNTDEAQSAATDEQVPNVEMDWLEAGEWPNWTQVADFMTTQGLTKCTQAEVAEILRSKFEHNLSHRRIATMTGIHHSTVGRVVSAAEMLLQPTPQSI